MRRILAGSIGLAFGLTVGPAVAQEPQWRAVAVGAPMPASTAAKPAVTLGAPVAVLGPPQPLTRTSYSRPVVRGQTPDQAPMPPSPAVPGAAQPSQQPPQPLPAPTPLGQPAPSAPVVTGPFTSPPPAAIPFYATGPVPVDNCLPGGAVGIDQGFAPLPGGVFVQDAAFAAPLVYANFEYLMWWFRDAQLPPLLTTGTPQSFGILGSGGRIIFGDSAIVSQERSGGRFTAGTWFTPCRRWGLEGSYFFLGEKNQTHTFADAGTAVLARPFQLPNGQETSEIIAFPRISAGTFATTTGNFLWGADINLKKNICAGCRSRLDFLTGFRYLKFDEDLQIAESFMGLAGGPFAGRSGMILDNFSVQNDFYGGQVGANWELRRGRWSLNLLSKVALGSTHQSIEITGGQMGVVNNQPFMAPGLLTQPTNVGKFSRDTFSVVPEVGLNLGWQATERMKLFVGYNFLYWSNVLRAGDQVDRVLNVNPNSFPIAQLPTGPARPTVLFRDSDFWAQGINFGLQLSW